MSAATLAQGRGGTSCCNNCSCTCESRCVKGKHDDTGQLNPSFERWSRTKTYTREVGEGSPPWPMLVEWARDHELLSKCTGDIQPRSAKDQLSLNDQLIAKLEERAQGRMTSENVIRPTLEYDLSKISTDRISGWFLLNSRQPRRRKP